ncbi:hypothetical protein LX36DRAFT_210333 [Colletotrichum falcatum]|nr:hypothetical protein LX36DRAFT_210333 [Colletotrichum falcatum]
MTPFTSLCSALHHCPALSLSLGCGLVSRLLILPARCSSFFPSLPPPPPPLLLLLPAAHLLQLHPPIPSISFRRGCRPHTPHLTSHIASLSPSKPERRGRSKKEGE